MIGYTFRAVSI